VDRRAHRPDVKLRDPRVGTEAHLNARLERVTPAPAASHDLTVWTGLGVLAVTALAFAIRLYRLDGRSLWLDEILTSQPAHLAGPAQVITWSQAAINQMPLFYMFTWFLGHWGDGAVILRLPAAIAGTLLVPTVFLTGRSLFGSRAGFMAALLIAVLPFAVWYSQEARNYSLLMLMTTLQMYFAFWSISRGRLMDWLGLAAFTVLNLYTHYEALTVTAAVAVYVLIFVVAGAVRGASPRVKAGVGVLLAVAAAAAVIFLHVAYDFALQHAKGHRAVVLGIVVAAVVVVVLLVGLLWRRYPALRTMTSTPRYRPLALAVATGIVVSLAYLPWVPSLIVFLGRPDQSLGQIHLGHAAGLSDLAYTLAGVDLTGFVLVTLCLGLVAVVLWAFAGKARESVLLLTWLGVPLGALVASAGRSAVAVDPRYLAFLVPAAMIVIAAGVEAIVSVLRRMATRGVRSGSGRLSGRAGTIAAVAVLIVLLVQTVPTLAASYAEPKNDYRALAQHIAIASPQGAVVIALGNYSDWTVICLDYYFRQLHEPDRVVDGLQLDRSTFELNSSAAGAWGVVIFPSSDQLALLNDPGQGPETVDFVDVTHQIFLVKPSTGQEGQLAQAQELLRWELPLEPALAASLARIGGATP
jgi:uncharacterized membrane protein